MIKPFEHNTTKLLWNDPYISSQMLKHHLDYTTDISSRTYYTVEKTVLFLIKQLNLEFGSSVCDLGCGPGLYTNLFQTYGYKVTGVDFSKNSIEYAKNQNTEVEYIEADYLALELSKQYDLMTLIYCDFCTLSPQNANKLLSNVFDHLKPKGYFFFDVHDLQYFQNQEEMIYTHTEENGFYMEGKATITETMYKYPELLLTLNHIVAKGSREVELYNWIKSYTRDEIEKLLHKNGFHIVETFDTTFGNVKKDTQYFSVLCQKNDE